MLKLSVLVWKLILCLLPQSWHISFVFWQSIKYRPCPVGRLVSVLRLSDRAEIMLRIVQLIIQLFGSALNHCMYNRAYTNIWKRRAGKFFETLP